MPIQCEYYALEGVGQLLRNVSLVQQNINPGLRLSGIVMTMFDPRTKLSEQVVEEVQRYFGDLVYDVIIPRTVRLSEAPGYGQPITVYDPKSKGAECYRELGREVALRPPPAEPMPSFDDLPEVVMPAMDAQSAPTPPIEESELDEIPTVHAVMDEADTETQVADTSEAMDELQVEAVQDEVSEAVEEALANEEAPEPEASEEEAPQGPTQEPPPVVEIREPVPARRAEPPVVDDDEDDVWEEDDASGTPQSRVRSPASPAPPGHLPERRVVVIDEDAHEPASVEPSRPRSVQEPAGGGHQPAVADIGATLEDEDDSRKRRWRLFRKGGE